MRVYHSLEAKWALDDIRRRRLKLAKIDDMNDPYEFRSEVSSHAVSQQALENLREDDNEAHGALCFSRSWNNILMWSHYGDRHKGVCLGFEVPKKFVRRVKYIATVQRENDLRDASRRRKLQVVNRLNWAKYEGWTYEKRNAS